MAEISKAVRDTFGVMADLVPIEIRKQISQEELADRLAFAADLSRRSQDATDPVARKSYATRAKAVIAAPPRTEIEHEYASRIAKAAGLPKGSRQADALLFEAREYLDANPVAPRRTDIAKAKAEAVSGDDLVPIYDAAGKLIGVCPRGAITPVISDPSEVKKAISAVDRAAMNVKKAYVQAVQKARDEADAGKGRRAAPGPTQHPGQR